MKKIILSVLFLIAFTGIAGAKDYVIGGGDSLQISVWGNPELSTGVLVRPDGKISLPALGEISAAGLTPTELKNILEKEMVSVVKNPIVTVIVTGMTNYQVLVFGGGTIPGIHILHKETTLLQFLSGLGALQGADLERAYIVRNKEKVKVGFFDLFIKGDLNQDITLEPDDILYIPDNFEKGIRIVGAVKNPTTVFHREGLTILDAILAAGGLNEFAKKNDVVIVRNKGGEKEMRLSVRVKDIMEGEYKENIKIMPGDFIIVPESFF